MHQRERLRHAMTSPQMFGGFGLTVGRSRPGHRITETKDPLCPSSRFPSAALASSGSVLGAADAPLREGISFSGLLYCTVRVTCFEWLRLPEVPVTVMV